MVANEFSDDSQRIIAETKRKLNKICTHRGNREWLGRHESSIRSTIEYAVRKSPVYLDALPALFVCLEDLRSHKTYQLWTLIVSDALLVAADLKDNKLQAQLWLAYGDFMLREGQHRMASRTAEIGTAFLPDETSDDADMQRVQALLIMICALQETSSKAITIPLIARALRLTRRTSNLALKARVYQLLAHIYAYQGNYKPATGFTQLALALWETLGDWQGKVDCLINFSRIARQQNQFDKVQNLMSQIPLDPNSSNGHQQFMHRMYEEAAFMLESGNFAKAREMLEWTIEYLQTMKTPHEMATVKHTLALTKIAQHDFEAAEENLATVDAIWRRLQRPYGQAEVCVARSYMERERGQKLQAREWLERAKAICHSIENEPLREQMLAMIDGENGKLDD